MAEYYEDFIKIFTEGFSRDVYCHFPEGLFFGSLDEGACFLNMSTMAISQQQPEESEWIRMRIVDGTVFNSAIGSGNEKLKSSIVFVEFDLFWPQSQSKKKILEIESDLDSLFLNIKFRTGTGDSEEIYSQQDSPKAVVSERTATGKNVFNEKNITYSFVRRFY